MTKEEALANAIEFFEQRDETAASYWEFNRTTRHEIAEALRQAARPEVDAIVSPEVCRNNTFADGSAKCPRWCGMNYCKPAGPSCEHGTFRKATPAENLRILRARLSDHLSPAEMRELEEAATLLSPQKTIDCCGGKCLMRCDMNKGGQS